MYIRAYLTTETMRQHATIRESGGKRRANRDAEVVFDVTQDVACVKDVVCRSVGFVVARETRDYTWARKYRRLLVKVEPAVKRTTHGHKNRGNRPWKLSLRVKGTTYGTKMEETARESEPAGKSEN